MTIPLADLDRDGRILFLTRAGRMFGYGLLAVVLVLYLAASGLTRTADRALLTLTLVGDTVISLWLTTHADRFGRRRDLIVGARADGRRRGRLRRRPTASAARWSRRRSASSAPRATRSGRSWPSSRRRSRRGQRRAAHRRLRLVQPRRLVRDARRARWRRAARRRRSSGAGWSELDAYRAIVVGYAVVGIAPDRPVVRCVSPAVEVPPVERARSPRRLGLHESRRIVLRLSALFALDAFGGGFVIQSLMAYWFHPRSGSTRRSSARSSSGPTSSPAVSALRPRGSRPGSG